MGTAGFISDRTDLSLHPIFSLAQQRKRTTHRTSPHSYCSPFKTAQATRPAYQRRISQHTPQLPARGYRSPLKINFKIQSDTSMSTPAIDFRAPPTKNTNVAAERWSLVSMPRRRECSKAARSHGIQKSPTAEDFAYPDQYRSE